MLKQTPVNVDVQTYGTFSGCKPLTHQNSQHMQRTHLDFRQFRNGHITQLHCNNFAVTIALQLHDDVMNSP